MGTSPNILQYKIKYIIAVWLASLLKFITRLFYIIGNITFACTKNFSFV